MEFSSDFLLYFDEVYENQLQSTLSDLNNSLDEIFINLKTINSFYQDLFQLFLSSNIDNIDNLFVEFSLFLSNLENLFLNFNSFSTSFKSSPLFCQ